MCKETARNMCNIKYNRNEAAMTYFKCHLCICLEGFKNAKKSEAEQPVFMARFEFGASPIRSMSGNYYTVTFLPESTSLLLPTFRFSETVRTRHDSSDFGHNQVSYRQA